MSFQVLLTFRRVLHATGVWNTSSFPKPTSDQFIDKLLCSAARFSSTRSSLSSPAAVLQPINSPMLMQRGFCQGFIWLVDQLNKSIMVNYFSTYRQWDTFIAPVLSWQRQADDFSCSPVLLTWHGVHVPMTTVGLLSAHELTVVTQIKLDVTRLRWEGWERIRAAQIMKSGGSGDKGQ